VDLLIAVEFILQRPDCKFEVTEGNMNLYIVPRLIYLLMKKQMLIFPLVAAMIFTIFLATVESVSAQNGTMGGNACMTCGPTTGTNLTNATNGGNVTNDNLSNPLLDKKSG
jgi:hypothetical protein